MFHKIRQYAKDKNNGYVNGETIELSELEKIIQEDLAHEALLKMKIASSFNKR